MTLLAAFKTLLYRYSEQESIVVGTPIAGRTEVETEELIGFFVNTLVLRTEIRAEMSVREVIERVKEAALGGYGHQEVPFEKVVEEMAPERSLSHTPLFQVMFVMQNEPRTELEMSGVAVSAVGTQSGTAKFDVTMAITEAEGGLRGGIEYNTDIYEAETIERMAGHFERILESMVERPEQRVGEIEMLTEDEQHQLLVEWNQTEAEYVEECVHEMFEAQVERTPDAVAVVFEDEEISYQELNRRANKLAHYLRREGVRAESLVAVMMERSVEMVVTLLGVLKAGGAYVPVDPEYPQERVRYMLEDSGAHVLLTETKLAERLLGELEGEHRYEVVRIDREWERIAKESGVNVGGVGVGAESGAGVRRRDGADNLAYVIYTSGSTGQPKGVMVNHGNVCNFFAGMDKCLRSETPGTWLTVTSISFDISVLELFWTLTRGFKVVIQSDRTETFYSVKSQDKVSDKVMDFSLFYFASDNSEAAGDKYRLLMEGARFADQHGFSAVWTPERHFHAFGGLYPNPSVTSAAIAAITENVGIRAGSVVLPLHSPIRVAEEWAVVDNISKGRVAISFASGWHVNDFVLAPESYADRKQIMMREIETVRKLWRGEMASFRSGAGNDVELKIFPQPIQKELPVWLTAAGNPETFQMAGEIGANILTHLLGQSIEDLSEKIAIYRESWREHGHQGTGHVSLMLHAYVGDDVAEVREKVREPFTNYLRSSVDLTRNLAMSLGKDVDPKKWTEEDMRVILEHAFDRFFETSGLFGTPETCLEKIDELKSVGVDEVACLIDFGVDFDSVMSSLENLYKLKEASQQATRAAKQGDKKHYTLPEQIKEHQVTHLQCTPSMARMLLLEPSAAESLGTVQELLLGGEALPVSLAQQLREVAPESMLNMYGPTETTIWSTVYRIDEVGARVPIGRPIANTEIFIVDKELRPVPVGVTGELLIGGAGVVRGYLERPEATAERFIPDPFSGQRGARLYKTGDRARYLPDGNIEFLGRIDQQVKVGGHRVELEEIESALVRHDWVREAVVSAREDETGSKRLVAYLVVNGDNAESLEQQLSETKSAALPANQRRYKLPNGMVVAQLSDFQTNVGYREIFENETYLKHGVTLNDGDCVFDVGANTGFFTLFVNQKCKGSKVYAFEPIPTTFEVLRANVELHNLNAKLFNCGVSDHAGSANFTFYPLMDGLSSRYADVEKDKQVTRSIILDWLQNNPGENGNGLFTPDELEQVIEERFRTETFTCPLRTLSDVIAEQGVERIDYLKVDCERSEFDVLEGIREEDWKKIKQVVLEVETDELLEKISTRLAEHNFEVNVEKIINVEQSAADVDTVHVYMLYAIQRNFQPSAAAVNELAQAETATDKQPSSARHEASINGVRKFLKESLPEYMVPSAFVLLDALPLTPNGKVDRKSLPDPDNLRPEIEVAYVEPETDTELLITGIWKDVLGIDRVGIHDNFFEVGGTSLLIAQVYSKLREHYHERITMVEMFRHPTIGSLAKFLGTETGTEQPVAQQVQERVNRQASAISQQQKLMAERRRQATAKKKPQKPS